MFTIRFIKHGGKGHTSYSCTSYETTHRGTEVEVKMVLKNEEEYFEQIGAEAAYDIAYVTNEAGRTIDKIVA